MSDSMRPVKLGVPIDRVDGRLKVTGGAKYAAELPITNPAYAVVVTSTIAKGRVTSIDTAAAERVKGVLAVLTPFNAPKVDVPSPRAQSGGAKGGAMSNGAAGPPARGGAMRIPTVLQSPDVLYNGQPIGLVVADSFEAAVEGAHLVTQSMPASVPHST